MGFECDRAQIGTRPAEGYGLEQELSIKLDPGVVST